jgi:predicted RNase H-like nuclease (RuvC/YqgF family)
MNQDLHITFRGERHANETYEQWLEKCLVDQRTRATDATRSRKRVEEELTEANRELDRVRKENADLRTRLGVMREHLEKSRLKNLAAAALIPEDLQSNDNT